MITPLPKRRLPRLAEQVAPAPPRTRSEATARSTRLTNDGRAETSPGWSRRSWPEDGAPNVSGGSSRSRASASVTARLMERLLGSAVAVLLFVVRAELPGLERPPPRLVLAIPRDRRPERLPEPVTRRPAELAHRLRLARVAPVVAGPVLHRLDQRLGFPGELEDLPREDDVLDLVAAPDVVDLAVAPFAQHQVDACAVVEDVEPVAYVLAVAIERQWRVIEGVRHEERDDLLRVLVGPEVVGRAGDQRRHPVGVPVGQHEQVPAGLRRRIRIGRSKGIALTGRAALDRSVHLVRADVDDARNLELFHGLQEREHAEDVGAQKLVGLIERTVDVRVVYHDIADASSEVVSVLHAKIIDVAFILMLAVQGLATRIVGRDKVHRIRRTLVAPGVTVGQRIVEIHHAEQKAETGGQLGRVRAEPTRAYSLVLLDVAVTTQVAVQESVLELVGQGVEHLRNLLLVRVCTAQCRDQEVDDSRTERELMRPRAHASGDTATGVRE